MLIVILWVDWGSMYGECAEGNGASLDKIKKICKFLNIAFKIIFVILCIYWVISTGSLIAALITRSQSGVDIFRVLLCIAYGAVVAAMFLAFTSIFSDVSKGRSPFEMVQVRRLRTIAGLLLVYAILDTAITGNSTLLQTNGMDSGYVSMNGNTITTFNFAPLIAAAVVFAFSFVFKYGVLLQEFSDDTL